MFRQNLILNLSVVTALLIGGSSCGGAKNVPSQPVVDHIGSPQRASQYLTATQDYGALTVRLGEIDATSTIKPWSSWWYPLNEKTLFEGGRELAPLEKLDQYNQRAHGKNSAAASYERNHIYDPQADGWEGLCNAWSAASILEPEPKHSITTQGITFKVSDQKALLLKSYERVMGLKQYGQRFDGQPGQDINDIYPDQFHLVMMRELFEKGRPVIIDKDAGIAVWNEPVYRMQTSILVDPRDPHLLHVDTFLGWADSGDVDPAFIGTKTVEHEYTYDLYGEKQPDGSYKISYGEWTGDSIGEHPDFVTIVPEGAVNHSSINTEIDPVLVKEIVSQP